MKKRKLTNAIKEARKKVKLTQEAMAEMLEIPVSTIRNWEVNRCYPPLYVERMIVDEIYRLTKHRAEMRIHYKACYTDTDRDWYGEYHDTLEDAIDEVKSLLYDKGCMHGYVYKTALALDEDGEWTEEAAVELGWTGDTFESYSPLYDIHNESEYLKTLDS